MTKPLILFLLSTSLFAQQPKLKNALNSLAMEYERQGYTVLGDVPAIVPVDDQKQLFIRFYQHFDVYFRKLYGCPLSLPSIDPDKDCHGTGVRDAKELAAMRQIGLKLKIFEDKKKPAAQC